MKKILTALLVAILFLTVVPSQTQARMKEGISLVDNCETSLGGYLALVGSPLAGEAGTFAKAAEENNLDCFLLPAITGVESTYGKAVPKGSANPFGWNNGRHAFSSWSEGILTVGNALGSRYALKWGAKTPEQIGKYYAADPNWGKKVRMHMARIKNFSSQTQPE